MVSTPPPTLLFPTPSDCSCLSHFSQLKKPLYECVLCGQSFLDYQTTIHHHLRQEHSKRLCDVTELELYVRRLEENVGEVERLAKRCFYRF